MDRRHTLVVLQPGYLPWLGFFDQLRRSDTFVLYDDVQYDKGGWRNRNRIKSPGGATWLTVPVRTKGRLRQRLIDVEIDNGRQWARGHISTIRHLYAGAPYLERYLPELVEVLSRPWTRLVDLDLELLSLLSAWFDLCPPTQRSSRLGIGGRSTGRLVDIALQTGATRYLTGDAAKAYLDVPLLADHGIEVEWHGFRHPTYAQQHGPFVPGLSALDLVLNCGDDAKSVLAAATDD